MFISYDNRLHGIKQSSQNVMVLRNHVASSGLEPTIVMSLEKRNLDASQQPHCRVVRSTRWGYLAICCILADDERITHSAALSYCEFTDSTDCTQIC